MGFFISKANDGPLQKLRLVQAIAETIPVKITKEDLIALDPIIKTFDGPFGYKIFETKNNNPNEKEIDLLPYLVVKHDMNHPETGICDLCRPLIWPFGIIKYCRKHWSQTRKNSFLFNGLIGHRRQESLSNWKQRNTEVESMISNSERGRTSIIRSWDETYFNMLCDYNFSLCPDGTDTTGEGIFGRWTYRFFESCFCGAIPIVETALSLYSGFHYKTWDEKVIDLKWSQDMAEENYILAISQVTLPRFDLINVLKSIELKES